MSTTNPAKDPADFLRRVVPWPAAGAAGFINMHWTSPRYQGMSGRPFNQLADFLAMVPWCNANPQLVKDVYFCLSQQAKTGATVNGKMKAARSAKDATFLKAIWLDVDGNKPDEPDKGYATPKEALEAIIKFVADAKLPPVTALVMSGGGWHVYWISDKPLTRDEWRPYAEGLWALVKQHGLRADPVTTDAARILRVPDTFNYKTNPPKPVKLRALCKDYDFATDLAALPVLVPTAAAADRTGSDDGTGREEIPPLDWEPLVKECAFLREALRTGGKDYSEPMWHLTTLLATFLKYGEKLAHRMGNQHPGYTPASTKEKWDRKLRDRKEKGLGFPQCKTIHESGCTACTTCQHFAKSKSPLNLSLPSAVLAQVKGGKINPVAALMTLRDHGADIKQLLVAMNQTFAAVKYGGQIVIAIITGNEIEFMKTDDFHKLFANLVVYEEVNDGRQGAPKKEKVNDGQQGASKKRAIKVSRRWFDWKGRRQYPGRGIVFEPGGPLEIPNDMLNLWRGFGIIPKPGDWSLMRAHILNVVCSGQQKHFDYLLHWMAYAVQHLDKPMGVAVAFLGAQGAGKGIVARTFGEFFGKHFTHIANGDQLTGRFNASLGASCAVFLDEALWAGDRKGEGVLKSLITEPSFQLEAKFRDPIMVENRLRIIVASNNDWAVPTGVGDRRWFVLNVADTYAGTGHRDYWSALYAEKDNGGTAAMLYDLLAMDLGGFDVRVVPHTAAKAQQQVLSLNGTGSWLHDILQEGRIGYERWNVNGLTISKDNAYMRHEEFSKQQHDWRPEIKDLWSKAIRSMLGSCVRDTRQQTSFGRVRSFQFAPLADCRRQFANHIGAPDLEWEPDNEPDPAPGVTVGLAAEDVGEPTEPDALHDAPSLEWEPELEPDPDYWPEYDPTDEWESD